MQGVLFKYDPDNDNKTRTKDVPEADIIGRVEGCWQEQIYFTPGSKPFDKSVGVTNDGLGISLTFVVR